MIFSQDSLVRISDDLNDENAVVKHTRQSTPSPTSMESSVVSTIEDLPSTFASPPSAVTQEEMKGYSITYEEQEEDDDLAMSLSRSFNRGIVLSGAASGAASNSKSLEMNTNSNSLGNDTGANIVPARKTITPITLAMNTPLVHKEIDQKPSSSRLAPKMTSSPRQQSGNHQSAVVKKEISASDAFGAVSGAISKTWLSTVDHNMFAPSSSQPKTQAKGSTESSAKPQYGKSNSEEYDIIPSNGVKSGFLSAEDESGDEEGHHSATMHVGGVNLEFINDYYAGKIYMTCRELRDVLLNIATPKMVICTLFFVFCVAPAREEEYGATWLPQYDYDNEDASESGFMAMFEEVDDNDDSRDEEGDISGHVGDASVGDDDQSVNSEGMMSSSARHAQSTNMSNSMWSMGGWGPLRKTVPLIQEDEMTEVKSWTRNRNSSVDEYDVEGGGEGEGDMGSVNIEDIIRRELSNDEDQSVSGAYKGQSEREPFALKASLTYKRNVSGECHNSGDDYDDDPWRPSEGNLIDEEVKSVSHVDDLSQSFYLVDDSARAYGDDDDEEGYKSIVNPNDDDIVESATVLVNRNDNTKKKTHSIDGVASDAFDMNDVDMQQAWDKDLGGDDERARWYDGSVMGDALHSQTPKVCIYVIRTFVYW